MKKINLIRKLRRKVRISANIFGTEKRPRVAVFRSNRYIYVQAIDDMGRKTLASSSSLVLSKDKGYKKGKKGEEAKNVGKKLAEILTKKDIKTAVFDRSLYAYGGRVKALAEGLREGGIKV